MKNIILSIFLLATLSILKAQVPETTNDEVGISDNGLVLELPLNGTLETKPNNNYPIRQYGNSNFVTNENSIFKTSLQSINYGGVVISDLSTSYQESTYMMWVKTQSNPVSLINLGGNQTLVPIFTMFFSNGNLGIVQTIASPPDGTPVPSIKVMNTPLPSLNDGQWHHLAITNDVSSKILSLYFDGQLVTTATFGSTINNSQLPEIVLGTSGFISGDYSGTKDFSHFRIYSKVLSAQQIKKIMLSDQGIKPEITSFSPTTLRSGATLTIEGSNFGTVASEITVTFNGGATAVASSATDTNLSVTIPENAKSGTITVSRVGIVSKESSSSLTIVPVPTILSFSPKIRAVGSQITIEGSNFSALAAENTITFGGGATEKASTATETSMTVTIPEGAQSGTITVTSDGAISQHSTETLTILPVPTIVSLSPTALRWGATLTIEGSNFGSIASEITVSFGGGATAVASSATDTRLTVTIPDDATSGTITVSRLGIVSNESSGSLTIVPDPTILSFSPNVGTIGGQITIEGSNFSAVAAKNTITFGGGATEKASSATETSMTVNIPDGAKSGKIAVTSDGAVSQHSTETLTIRPTINSFSPTAQWIGETIQITGTGFSTTAGNNTVTFAGGVTAKASSATTTTLTVTIPMGAITGSISITSDATSSSPSSTALTIQGVVINFHSLVNNVPSYSEDGYTILSQFGGQTCESGYCILQASGPTIGSKGAYLASSSLNFFLSPDSSSPITLYSLELRNLNGTVSAQTVTFVGTLVGGGTVSHTVTTQGATMSYQKFDFPETFTNLVSVSWNPKITVVSEIKVAQ